MAKGVALVTGGGRRIGAEITSTLIDEGWYVLVHVRSSKKEAIQLLEQKSTDASGSVVGEVIEADLATDDGLARLIEQTKVAIQAQNSDGPSHQIVN